VINIVGQKDKDTKYFQVIPAPKAEPKKLPVPQALINKVLYKQELKSKREEKLNAARELAKEVYNISMNINKIDAEIDEFILNKATEV